MLLTIGPADIYDEKSVINPLKRTTTHSKMELVELTKHWKKPYDEQFFLDKKRTTMDFHLNKLIKADVVEKVKVGRKIKYQIKDEFKVWLFLANYKDAFSDDLVDIRLYWHDDFIRKRIDAVIKVTEDLFPNPYHA